MEFKTITEIKEHKWTGDAYHDMPAFNAIHTFVTDKTNALSDKAEALRIMSNKAMGCDQDEHIDDHKLVTDYLAGTEIAQAYYALDES